MYKELLIDKINPMSYTILKDKHLNLAKENMINRNKSYLKDKKVFLGKRRP
jgi:hypothetical protein